MGRPSTSTLTNCTPDGWPCPGGAKAAGPLFYRKLAALGILCDLGRVLKQVPISQGLSAAFFSAGWPVVLGRENAG